MAAITGLAYTGTYQEGAGSISALAGSALGTGYNHTTDMAPIIGLASEGVYGEAYLTLNGAQGIGFEDAVPDNVLNAVVMFPAAMASGSGSANALDTQVPAIEAAEIRGGGSAMALELPFPEVTVEATWPGVGRMGAEMPLVDLEASGLATGLGHGAVNLAPLMGDGRGGGGCIGFMVALDGSGAGETGGVGSLAERGPAFGLRAEGGIVAYGRADGRFQALDGHGIGSFSGMNAPVWNLRGQGGPE